MLMTQELSDLQETILGVLRGANKPLSRSEIAHEIGRPKRLVPYDVELLEGLVDMGLVLKSEDIIGTVKTVMKYRAID